MLDRLPRPTALLLALVGLALAPAAHAEAPGRLAPGPDADGASRGPRGPLPLRASSEDGGGGGRGRSDSEDDDGGETKRPDDSRQKPPVVARNTKVTIDFVDAPLADVVKYMAEITGRNFILNDDLKGEITIISHQPVSIAEAYEAFLSAMEMEGFTTVTVGMATKVVSTGDAASNPLRVYEGADIPYTDNYVTQIIQLENVQVGDISSVVKDLAGKGAKIIAYAPTNTLIITDAAVNIRRVYRIISQLDVASPKSKMELIPLRHATASEIQRIIQELYGTADTSSGGASQTSSRRQTAAERRRARAAETRKTVGGPNDASASANKVGAEGKYIEKIISDERTNSLIVMANEEAIAAVRELIAKLDSDVDPQSQAKIRVRYLEHAKAADVAQVLSQLSQGGSGGTSSRNSAASSRNRRAPNNRNQPPGRNLGGPLGDDGGAEGSTSAVAAFDSGLRITSDENTNSLVIIATRDQFAIIDSVIEQLDIPRKQVFVEAVILELSTQDEFNVGLGVHMGKETPELGDYGSGVGFGSAQMNGSSTGFSTDLLSGLAVGVFGPELEATLPGLTEGITIPAFGVVLNALQSNGTVNIVSTPNLLTMDNEEAKIVVGRNVPFPVGTGRDNNNNPIISFQREDVAITLKVTPQINESNYVTLQVFQEVQEIESDTSNLDPLTSGGPTTSKRSVESTVVVKDNQTIVLGGLIGETDTEVETKVPILGDLPLIGALFRGRNKQERKTNLLIFLTPHIISEPADLEEVYRVKVAQRQEFLRRFYGKSLDEQEAEMRSLLSYSMNQIDRPSRYRGPTLDDGKYRIHGDEPVPGTDGTLDQGDVQDAVDAVQDALPGAAN